MSSANSDIRELFDELKPGDRIEVVQTESDGRESWRRTTVGSVVRTEHHCGNGDSQRSGDENALANVILLELPDGELTAVTVDELTVIRRA